MRALFKQFPALSANVAHVDLGLRETPVERIEVAGTRVLVKRDDLSADPLGGNKVRALEFLLAGAERGDTVLTVGSSGSTHALATAIYARDRELACEVITWPQEEHEVSRRTAVRLADLADVTAARSPVHAYLQAAVRRIRGRHWVPAGGSSPRGALGSVSAGIELVTQLRSMGAHVEQIVLPLGSGGTAAGLVAGLSAIGERIRVVGVRVVPRIVGNRGHVLRLAWQTHRLIARYAGTPIGAFNPALLEIEHREYGGAYARETARARDAMAQFTAAGGPVLDGTYSAKAVAPALERAREQGDGAVLFWLTFDARWLTR